MAGPGWNCTPSTLALISVVAVFAWNLMPVMGQYDDSYSIQNDLGIPLIVHCKDTAYTNDQGVITVQPGQVYSHGFVPDPISYVYETYTCDFEQDTPTGPLKQKFAVWVTQDLSNGPITGSPNTHWHAKVDGFWLEEDPDLKYGWQGRGRVESKNVL